MDSIFMLLPVIVSIFKTDLGIRNNTKFSGSSAVDQAKMNAYYNEGYIVNMIGD